MGQESKETIGVRVTEDQIKTLVELLNNGKNVKVDITGSVVTCSFLLNDKIEKVKWWKKENWNAHQKRFANLIGFVGNDYREIYSRMPIKYLRNF